MGSSFHFPDAKILRDCLSTNCALLPFQKYSGLVAVIAEMAAKQFANQTLTKSEVSLNCGLIVVDIKCGETGLNHLEDNPHFPLSKEEWEELPIKLIEALSHYVKLKQCS